MTKPTKTYEDGIKHERLRIHNEIKKMEDRSHQTRTPIYQDTFFKKIKEILHGTSN
jgi:hypothetical protein